MFPICLRKQESMITYMERYSSDIFLSSYCPQNVISLHKHEGNISYVNQVGETYDTTTSIVQCSWQIVFSFPKKYSVIIWMFPICLRKHDYIYEKILIWYLSVNILSPECTFLQRREGNILYVNQVGETHEKFDLIQFYLEPEQLW